MTLSQVKDPRHVLPSAGATMYMAVFTVQVLLAGVFLLAGLSKARAGVETLGTLVAFGLSPRAAYRLGPVLAASELIVGLGLLSGRTARLAATGALILLVVFTAVVILKLARGSTPSCGCFGSLSRKPISPITLIRNLVLLLAAFFVVMYSRASLGLSPVAWLTEHTHLDRFAFIPLASIVLLSSVLGGIIFRMFLQGRRSFNELNSFESASAHVHRIADFLSAENEGDGLAIGSRVPEFELVDLNGEKIATASLTVLRKGLIFVFVRNHCQACKVLLTELQKWQNRLPSSLQFVIITVASRFKGAKQLSGRSILLARGANLAKLFGAVNIPSAVFISEDGKIGSVVACDVPMIRALVAQIVIRQSSETIA